MCNKAPNEGAIMESVEAPDPLSGSQDWYDIERDSICSTTMCNRKSIASNGLDRRMPYDIAWNQ